METKVILGVICVIILLGMLMYAYYKPYTTTSTKVVTTQPNTYVVHTNVPTYHQGYYPNYNSYKAQYYN
jgi:predicted Abi (CAAX) family protease